MPRNSLGYRLVLTVFTVLLVMNTSLAQRVEFTEGFNGEFEAPDWVASNLGDPVFVDGALQVNKPKWDHSTTTLGRRIGEGGSFVTSIDFRELDFGMDFDRELGNDGVGIGLRHQFSTLGLITFTLNDPSFRPPTPGEWILSILAPNGFRVGEFVPRSTGPVQFRFTFLEDASEFLLTYDSNADDDVEPILFGPYHYEGSIGDIRQYLEFAYFLGGDAGPITSLLDSFSLHSIEPISGDFDVNGVLDVRDLDLLAMPINAGESRPLFDLDGDGEVSESDRDVWVHDLANTYYGDSNLDGEFNSRDLTLVFQAAEYEDDIDGNSTWAEGDWNGDGDFTSRDLVFAFQDDGYEKGPRVTAVPEPRGLLLVGFVTPLLCRSKLTERTNRSPYIPSSV